MNWKLLSLGIPLVAALVACPAPVTPSYTLEALSPASLTFTKPTTGNSAPQIVNLTITPKDGFSSDLTAELVGPTGVSATAKTIPAGTTSAQLSVVVANTATVGADQAYTVRTSGGGVDPQTQALKVTVNAGTTPPPPPAPNFTISASAPAAVTKPSSGTVATTSTITVTPSNGFTGNVVVTAAPTITGVTFSSLTIAIPSGGTAAVTGTLTATVGTTASVATTAVTVTGTGTISGASAARTATPVNLTVNATPPPALDHITVTGTANLNLNTPTQFTAVGYDASNVPLPTQPTFTWTSADTSKATVDSTGKVTAIKSITAPVTITATSGAKSGTFNATSSYGMEVSVGTYNQDGTIVGTAFLVRLRDSGGAIVAGQSGAQSYNIAGPATWNNDVAATATGNSGDFVWGLSDAFGILRTPPGSSATVSTPVNGTYTFSSIFGAVTYTGKAQLADKTISLPAPVVTATRTTTTVNSSWTADASAKSFRVQLFKKNGATTTLLQTDNQTALTRDYTGLTVVSGDQFFVRVIAYPVIINAADVTPLPTPFNISSKDSTPTTPEP